VRKVIIAMLTAALVAAVGLPATASASYNIGQRTAEKYAASAAKTKYKSLGIKYVGTACSPTGMAYRTTVYGRYHRWDCTWVGDDFEGDRATGRFLITGSSDTGYYYYRVLRGIHWPSLDQTTPSPSYPNPSNEIPNYPNGNGYPVQCNDGQWSQSGGIQGACSHHGGVAP
jgi:hypothetical protein